MGYWGDAADLALSKVCNERRKCNTCGCRGRGKKGNPCDYAILVRESALRLDERKEPEPGDVPPTLILAYVNGRRCTHSRNGDTAKCKHLGCQFAETLVMALTCLIGGVDYESVRRSQMAA